MKRPKVIFRKSKNNSPIVGIGDEHLIFNRFGVEKKYFSELILNGKKFYMYILDKGDILIEVKSTKNFELEVHVIKDFFIDNDGKVKVIWNSPLIERGNPMFNEDLYNKLYNKNTQKC
jgi:hypothetical protein